MSVVVIASSAAPQSLEFLADAALNNLFDSRAQVALPAAGVGCNFNGDCTVEMFIAPSSTAADNNDTAVTEGANYNTNGNIIIDRDLNSQSPAWILGISAGLLYFTCNTSSSNQTRVGTTDLRDGLWHHVAVTRVSSTGVIELYVDGSREDTGTGPTGSLAMPDAHTPLTTCGVSGNQDCANSDEYMVLGTEKHEFQSNGYIGLLSCLRISDNIRYTGATYTEPTAAFTDDANTIGLWQMTEGSGTTIADESGDNQTMTMVADSNNTPRWSSSGPFD